MKRWIFPLVLLVVAAVAAWQAVRTEAALAEETEAVITVPQPGAATPMFSIRRAPQHLREPVVKANLADDLAELAPTFPSQSCLVVTNGVDVLYEWNATLPLVPASTQKILTAFGVYELLGPDVTYRTAVVAEGEIVDGRLDGNLWIVGDGDPLLASERYSTRYEGGHAYTDIAQLADDVVAAGITEITGGVFGDESEYDLVRYVPEWPTRFTNESQNQTGPLSALTINDGVSVYDSVNTASSLNTAATEPAVFAASLFDDLLEDRGVIIRQGAQSGIVPLGSRELAAIESDPISVVTNQMLDVSDNMGAEMLLKEIGHVVGSSGSTIEGANAIEQMLRSEGFSTTETDVVDGSGLASENRVTCRLLAEVLDASTDSPLPDGLAVSGESGTLLERMVGTAAQGVVRAKTGRLNEVGALAGFVTASDGTDLTFAWLANTTDLYPVEQMMASQDAVALELVAYPVGPSVDALAPPGS